MTKAALSLSRRLWDVPTMCGRFTQQHSWAELVAILRGFLEGPFRVDDQAPEPRASYNIKPTQQVAILTGKDEPLLTSARWWFVPHWYKGDTSEWKQTTFNARIETAAEKPTFRTAWVSSRCVIPCTGYFEWTGPKKARVPWFISVVTNAPLAFFAGLASRLEDGTRTCTVLTRAALPQIAHLHDRVPVMLTEGDMDRWLRHELGTDEVRDTLGADWEGRFKYHRVAPLKRDRDGPEIIQAIE